MLKALLFDDEYIVLEALSCLPDLVLTDIRMPGKDELQLIEEFMEEASDTCCIVFRDFSEIDYKKRAIRLGVVDYVEKPITETNIERSIRQS